MKILSDVLLPLPLSTTLSMCCSWILEREKSTHPFLLTINKNFNHTKQMIFTIKRTFTHKEDDIFFILIGGGIIRTNYQKRGKFYHCLKYPSQAGFGNFFFKINIPGDRRPKAGSHPLPQSGDNSFIKVLFCFGLNTFSCLLPRFGVWFS